MRANQLHDSVALAESLLDDVERIRGEIRYLTWRTKRHKQTVDSNALRTTWLTFIEIVVLCMCAWMQIHAVKEYFATSSGDLVEGGRSQGFEYQGKYESVRNVGPAGGFGPGSGNFGMPPVPQMFQSQQQQRPAAPQMYQQHPRQRKSFVCATKHSTVKTTSFRERFLRKAFCRINMAEAPPHRRERVDSIKIDRFYNFILFFM